VAVPDETASAVLCTLKHRHAVRQLLRFHGRRRQPRSSPKTWALGFASGAGLAFGVGRLAPAPASHAFHRDAGFVRHGYDASAPARQAELTNAALAATGMSPRSCPGPRNRPRSPTIRPWTDPNPAFGVEFKNPAAATGTKSHTKWAAQAVDYTHTDWDGYGRLLIAIPGWLWCLRWSVLAEDGGFEPPKSCPLHAFQACALGH
jgi:hypothetical protein